MSTDILLCTVGIIALMVFTVATDNITAKKAAIGGQLMLLALQLSIVVGRFL